MSYAKANLGGSLTPAQAQVELKMKVEISTFGNERACQIPRLDTKRGRQVDIGMCLILCAGFERFLYDVSGEEKTRNWFRDFVLANGNTKLANECDAYWQIRHALSHYGGATAPLTFGSRSLSPLTRATS